MAISLGIEIENIDLVIAKYDKDNDGKINYVEFTKALTPKNSKYLVF